MIEQHHLVFLLVVVVAAAGLVVFKESFADQLCGQGMVPVLVEETGYGTGKVVIQECVPEGTIVPQYGNRFPSLKQRNKVPPGRISY